MHTDTPRSHKYLRTAAWVLGGVVAAPYVFPALGIGQPGTTAQITNICGMETASLGLAGTINEMLAAVPGIGSSLAAGGWSSTLWSGGIGLGGMLLGNYIHKHYDKESGIQWGKIIKYAALATSVLIALPSVLTGLTIGISYLAFTAAQALTGNGAAFGSSVLGATSHSVGLANVVGVSGGVGALLPHVLTRGATTLPMASNTLIKHRRDDKRSASTITSWTTRVSQQQADQMQGAPSLA